MNQEICMPFENHAFHVMLCPQVANWICIPLLLKMWFVFELQASDPDFLSCVILNFHTCYNDTFDTNVGDAYFVSIPANPPSGAGWWQANIGRCNVLVHVGIKPFSEAELTHTHVARWRHLTTMGWYYHLNRNYSVDVHLALQWRHEWARWRLKITSLLMVCWTVCSGADQRKHQSSASSAFVSGVHRWPVNSLSRRAGDAENVSIWWRHLSPCIHYLPHTWHGEWKFHFYNDYCIW